MFLDTVKSEIFARKFSREFYQQSFAKLKPYRNGEITLSNLQIQEDLRFEESDSVQEIDWPQSLKQFFINVSFLILVANLSLMALF